MFIWCLSPAVSRFKAVEGENSCIFWGEPLEYKCEMRVSWPVRRLSLSLEPRLPPGLYLLLQGLVSAQPQGLHHILQHPSG